VRQRRGEAVRATQASIERLMATVEPGTVDLVVWPEVAFPTRLDSPLERGLVEWIGGRGREAGAPVLVGAYGSLVDSGAMPVFTNAAFVVTGDGIRGEP